MRRKDDPISCEVASKYYPVFLFHATSHVSDVLRDGLKPRCEIGKSCGLGSPDSEVISFTYLFNYASIISIETKRLVEIARGKYDWITIEDLVVKDRIEKEGRNGLDIWKRLVDEYSKTPRTQENLFELYKNYYLGLREAHGGMPDPFFMYAYFDNFKMVDPDEVGVVFVKAYLPRPFREYIDMLRYPRSANLDLFEPLDGCYRFIGGPEYEIRLRKGMFGVPEKITSTTDINYLEREYRQ
jgi:hypothetical protein